MKAKGQASIEMVLMVVLFVGVAIFVGNYFREKEIFANLVSGPWQSFSGLIQNGVIGNPQNTMSQHPNQFGRLASVKGEEVKQ
jgi:hypothetical protein